MESKVAVCIPTYNQADYLAETVESVFAQTYPNVEVWVSDDCSTDDTPQIAARLKEKHPRLHYFRQEQNLGMCGNINWLLEKAEADFIVKLDSDDFLAPSYVQELLDLSTKYPQAGYAHGDVQEVDGLSQTRKVRRLGGRKEYQDPDTALRSSVSGYRVAANICMFRADVLRELCYYRSHISYAHDWDLSIRFAELGWGNAYCSKTLASYRVWEDDQQTRSGRILQEIRDCIAIYEETLIPAFEKRGWNLEVIRRQRVIRALGYALVLDLPAISSRREEITEAILRLDTSPKLRLQLKLVSHGAGSLLRWRRDSINFVKTILKRILKISAIARMAKAT